MTFITLVNDFSGTFVRAGYDFIACRIQCKMAEKEDEIQVSRMFEMNACNFY